MPWTDPADWLENELVTADKMNTELSENMDELSKFIRERAQGVVNFSTKQTTSATSFTDLVSLSVTTQGWDVMVGVCGSILESTANAGTFAVKVDNGPDEEVWSAPSGIGENGGILGHIAFLYWTTGLAAGDHTIAIRWRRDDTTGSRELALRYGHVFAIEYQPGV